MKQTREEPKTKRHKVEPILCPRCKGKGYTHDVSKQTHYVCVLEGTCPVCDGEGYIEE